MDDILDVQAKVFHLPEVFLALRISKRIAGVLLLNLPDGKPTLYKHCADIALNVSSEVKVGRNLFGLCLCRFVVEVQLHQN